MDGVAMEHSYTHLSQEERVQIFHWHANGKSERAIGLIIGRHHSTVSRELVRNSKATKQYEGGYEPVRARDWLRDAGSGIVGSSWRASRTCKRSSSNVLRWKQLNIPWVTRLKRAMTD
jgi:Helix-turn-helix domain